MTTYTDYLYAKVLLELKIDDRQVLQAKEFLKDEILFTTLCADNIDISEKKDIIDKIFEDKTMANFVKILCENHLVSNAKNIFRAYETLSLKQKGIIKAKLICTAQPTAQQIEGMKKVVCKKLGCKDAEISVKISQDIMGGFILRTDDFEIDRSFKTKLMEIEKTLVKR